MDALLIPGPDGYQDRREKSRLRLVIKSDSLVLTTDPITGAVLSEFHSLSAANAWSGGRVPFVDRRREGRAS